MKKWTTLSLCLAALLCLVLFATPKANAASVSDLYYSITYGKVTITDCKTSATGSLTIPSTIHMSTVTSIGNYAFRDCTSLTSITIPSSVTQISGDAFYGCTNLKGIWVNKSNPNYCSDSYGVVFNKDMTELIAVPRAIQNYTVPDSVTTIGSSAFSGCTNLTNITIPDSVTTIGSYAFYNCSGLSSVAIPDGVTTIGDSAFRSCTSLTSITIPDSVTTIGDYAFSGCDLLTSVTLGKRLKKMGDGAFYNCTSLADITIPDSVTAIGSEAFRDCYHLTSITIPDSVTTLGENVFSGCTNLQYSIYDNGKYLGNANNPYVYLQDTVSDTNMQMTVHPNTKLIGVSAFRSCTSLTSITIPDSVTTIGSCAFYNCSSLSSVTIPDSVTTIGSYAFYNCSGLSSVTISDGVTIIGSAAFLGCNNLTNVTIPDSVTYIGDSAFSGCDLLTSVTLGKRLEKMGYGAFRDCTSLTSINIPASVTIIGNEAFYNCTSLQDVYITDPSAWCKIKIDDLPGNPMYYAQHLHILDENGNEVTEIVLDDSVTKIPSCAFRGCTSLTSVTIPDGITTIKNKTFSNCTGLTELTLPDSITGVGNSAFSGCKSLKNVYYSGSQAQWQKITIESYNSRLTDATVHYDHIHDYSLLPAETVAPTCTDSGYTIYTCAHGDTRRSDFVPALGHQEASVPVCDPTCTEKGVSEAGIRCQRCEEYILEPVWIDALGHSFTEYVPNNDGTKTATCTICGIVDTVADKSTWLIVSQPEPVNADSGEAVSFFVGASGEIVSYRWQYRKLYKWFDTTMTGYDTDSLTVTATGARNGYDYRCVVTYSDGTVLISEPAELTVNTNITVTGDPNDQTAALGTKGQFTAAAEGEGIRYQWQYCRPNSEKWIDTAMEGATKPTVLIETTTARDGYMYRCKITDVTGKVTYTEAATLRVLSIQDHPEDQIALTGKTATFTVKTNVTEGVTYQWQYRMSETASWTDTTMTGYNTATLTVSATKIRNGYQYRCVITGAKNGKLTSNAAVLSVSDPVSITAQPENVTAAAAGNAVFTVDAANVTAYRWQYSRNGTTWYDTTATGCKTATLTVAAKGKNGYQYRCILTAADGTEIISDSATLNIQ